MGQDDFTYRPKRNVHIQYKGGLTYKRVPEAAVRAIVAAGKGSIKTEFETICDE